MQEKIVILGNCTMNTNTMLQSLTEQELELEKKSNIGDFQM